MHTIAIPVKCHEGIQFISVPGASQMLWSPSYCLMLGVVHAPNGAQSLLQSERRWEGARCGVQLHCLGKAGTSAVR